MPVLTPDNGPAPWVVDVFLAGSIEQGRAPKWHGYVAEKLMGKLGNDLVILNPRVENWDTSIPERKDHPAFFRQVEWELQGIDRAKVIFFYFVENTISPVSLLELGWAIGMGSSVVVVVDPAYHKQGNIEMLCDKAGITVHDTLESGIVDVFRRFHWLPVSS